MTPSNDNTPTLVPHTSVMPNAHQQAAVIIRAMLNGTWDKNQIPDIGQFNGHGAIIEQLFEGYRCGGQRKVWEMMTSLVYADPKLAELVIPQSASPLLNTLQPDDVPFRIYTVSEFMQLPPLKYLDQQKWLPERALIILFGAAANGKSLVANHLAAELADTIPVLLVLGEGQSGMPDRLRAEEMARGKPLSENYHVMNQPVDLQDKVMVNQFTAHVKARGLKPKLIIFDTLSACAPGLDENAPAPTSALMHTCKHITQELDTAVMLLHHTVKDGDGYRGHSNIHTHSDVMLSVKQDKNKVITVKGFKSKDGPVAPETKFRIKAYITRKNEEGEDVIGAAILPYTESTVAPTQAAPQSKPSTPRIKPVQRALLEALATHEQGMRNGELAEAASIGKTNASNVLKTLVEAGYVIHPDERGPYIITEQGKALLHA